MNGHKKGCHCFPCSSFRVNVEKIKRQVIASAMWTPINLAWATELRKGKA